MSNRFASCDEYGLRHLPRHLLHGERWRKIEQLLTDFDFLEVKCSKGMVYDLLQDFALAKERRGLLSVAQMREALALELSNLASRPEFAVQLVYNRLAWFEDPEPILREQLETARSKLNR